MPHPIVAKIKPVRSDLSDWVWHFVNRGPEAFQTLETILQSQTLLGSYDRSSDCTVICFTEAPAYEFARQSAVLESSGYARLSDYGIGFRKTWLYENGGLPVIYEPRWMLSKYPGLPERYRFRHVPYDPIKGPDYTWQREWRVNAKSLTFTPADAVIVIPSYDEGYELLFDIEEDGDFVDGIAESFASLVPRWSFVAHDQFKNITDLNDNAIELSIRDELCS